MTARPMPPAGAIAIDPTAADAAFMGQWTGPQFSAPPGPVVRIPVVGALTSSDWWGASYRDIEAALRAAAAQVPAPRSIVLDIDSPGGTVTGIAETVAAIEAARAICPVIAYVRGTCASAAYWLAAACDRIVSARTANVGCVGAIVAFWDFSGAVRQMGAERYRDTSTRTPLKAPDPGTPAFDLERQALVDAAGDAFLADLARLRSLAPDLDAVAEFYGRGLLAPALGALQRGWIDAVVDADADDPNAWLASGDEPEDDDDEDPPSSYPYPMVRPRRAAATQEEGAMPKTEGGAPPLTDAHAEAMRPLLAQIAALSAENADLKAKLDEAAAVTAKRDADNAELRGRVAAVEAALQAQAKAHAEQAARAEVAALIDGAIRRGAVGPGSRESLTAMAAEHGTPALKAALALIPDEAHAPRGVLSSGGTPPTDGADPLAERQRIADEARAMVEAGKAPDYWTAVNIVTKKGA